MPGLCLGLGAQNLGDSPTRRCGTDAWLQAQLEEQNMSIDEYLSHMDAQMHARHSTENRRQAQNETLYTLPIVVHLIYYPDSTLESNSGNLTDCHVLRAMEELNKVFSQTHGLSIPAEFEYQAAGDTGFRFELATRDPEGNPTTGILRHPIEGQLATAISLFNLKFTDYTRIHRAVGPWHTGKYINVYVYPKKLYSKFRVPTLGIGTFPVAGASTHLYGRDFVGINSIAFSPIPPHDEEFSLSRTFPHEIGHYLNLFHTWGAGRGGCNLDDFCEDTPKTFRPANTCGANLSCDPTLQRAMTENYMDYADDACYRLFTSCQKERMQVAFTAFRYNLYANNNYTLEDEPPTRDLALYTEYSQSRPHALYDTETRRFLVDTLFLVNQGQTAVNNALVKFSLDGTEIGSFTLNRRFGFCELQKILVPMEIQHVLKTAVLDPSSEHTLAISVNTRGDGRSANDTLHISRMMGPPLVSVAYGTPSGETAKVSSLIKLFPNPSNKEVFLSVETEQKQGVQVSFFDALGNLVYRQDFEVTPRSNRIAFSPTVKGGALYFVHIKTKTLDDVRRLIMR